MATSGNTTYMIAGQIPVMFTNYTRKSKTSTRVEFPSLPKVMRATGEKDASGKSIKEEATAYTSKSEAIELAESFGLPGLPLESKMLLAKANLPKIPGVGRPLAIACKKARVSPMDFALELAALTKKYAITMAHASPSGNLSNFIASCFSENMVIPATPAELLAMAHTMIDTLAADPEQAKSVFDKLVKNDQENGRNQAGQIRTKKESDKATGGDEDEDEDDDLLEDVEVPAPEEVVE